MTAAAVAEEIAEEDKYEEKGGGIVTIKGQKELKKKRQKKGLGSGLD